MGRRKIANYSAICVPHSDTASTLSVLFSFPPNIPRNDTVFNSSVPSFPPPNTAAAAVSSLYMPPPPRLWLLLPAM